jgi:TonB family protein
VDPALFALPNQQGFSGLAWLSLVPMQHQITNWTLPPRLLAPVATLLGEPFRVYARTSQVPALEVAVLTAPQATEVKVPPETTLTRSALRLEGDLAAWTLLTLVALPSIANSELLQNSVVRVVVDAKGWVRSQALLASSGARRADQLALETARAMRFQPFPDGTSRWTRSPAALTRGELVFQWHTLAASNAASEGN